MLEIVDCESMKKLTTMNSIRKFGMMKRKCTLKKDTKQLEEKLDQTSDKLEIFYKYNRSKMLQGIENNNRMRMRSAVKNANKTCKKNATKIKMESALKMGIKSALKMDMNNVVKKVSRKPMFLIHQQPNVSSDIREDGSFPVRGNLFLSEIYIS